MSCKQSSGRPADQLDELVRFYHDGPGLPAIGHFGGEGHGGCDGVMPGSD